MFSLTHKAFCLLTVNKRTLVFFCFLGFCETWRLQPMPEVAKWSCALIQAHLKKPKQIKNWSLQVLRRVQISPVLSNRFRGPLSQALDFCLLQFEFGRCSLWRLFDMLVLVWALYIFFIYFFFRTVALVILSTLSKLPLASWWKPEITLYWMKLLEGYFTEVTAWFQFSCYSSPISWFQHQKQHETAKPNLSACVTPNTYSSLVSGTGTSRPAV